jgi:hypothetical protein
MYSGGIIDPKTMRRENTAEKWSQIKKRRFPPIHPKILSESLKIVNEIKKVHALQPS